MKNVKLLSKFVKKMKNIKIVTTSLHHHTPKISFYGE